MDNIVQAASGVMAKTGFADGPPLRAGHHDRRSHERDLRRARHARRVAPTRRDAAAGQLVDVAMSTCSPRRCGTSRSTTTPRSACRRAPATPTAGRADQHLSLRRRWVSVTCTSDRQWQLLCDLMARDDVLERWPDDPRAGGRRARDRRSDRSVDIESRPVREVEAALLADRVAGRTRARADRGRATIPALHERGLLTRAPPSGRARRPAERLPRRRRCRSAFEGRVDLPPAELLGASTDAVLRELAGCDDAELARLRADGVIA